MILIYSKHNVQMSILFKGNEWLLNKGDHSINRLFRKYHYLLHHIHSHPDGSLDPSLEGGDLGAVRTFIDVLGYSPTFQIYSPISGQYKTYDQNTKWELDEIIINGN